MIFLDWVEFEVSQPLCLLFPLLTHLYFLVVLDMYILKLPRDISKEF